MGCPGAPGASNQIGRLQQSHRCWGAFLLHDGLSFTLTLGMRLIHRRIYRLHKELLWIIGSIVVMPAAAALVQLVPYYLLGHPLPFEEETLRDLAEV